MRSNRPFAQALLFGLFVAVACGDDPREPIPVLPPPDGVVALTVESEQVTSSTLVAIAAAQDVSPQEAAERAVFDAAFAADARRTLDRRTIRLLTDSVLARAVMADDWRKLQEPPTTAQELQEATQAFWLHYARPEGRRTGHAVVLAGEKDTPEVHAAARALANEILEAATKPVADSKDKPKPEHKDTKGAYAAKSFKNDPLLKAFIKAANRFKGNTPLKIVAEELGPIGRESIAIALAWPPGGVDPLFTAAAWTLSKRGDLSGVVKSSFGYHVIVLLEVTSANMLGAKEREAVLREQILRVRGKRGRVSLLQQLEKATKIELVPNHDALTGQIDVRVPFEGDEPKLTP